MSFWKDKKPTPEWKAVCDMTAKKISDSVNHNRWARESYDTPALSQKPTQTEYCRVQTGLCESQALSHSLLTFPGRRPNMRDNRSGDSDDTTCPQRLKTHRKPQNKRSSAHEQLRH